MKPITTPLSTRKAPPMGWNSWDCYGASVTEAEVLANARHVQKELLPYGWNTIVVDIQWSEPGADGWMYHPYAELCLDDYGRQMPAPNRFPSAADGKGFKPLADEIHGMGMAFGVHLMRGIPRLAVTRNLPILRTDVRARDIVNTRSICAWNTDMYGVDASKEGAQAYYDSVFALFAEWGVDYVKVDDIAWNFVAEGHYPAEEVALIHRAIAHSGRPMFLSLSPGPADPRHRAHYHHYANAWRITDDFWDQWPLVARCIRACTDWAGESGDGSWPDADMLPFGRLLMRETGADGKPGKPSGLTQDEEQLVFRLWCLMRSPLMIGADLPSSESGVTERLKQLPYLEWSQAGSPSALITPPEAMGMLWTQREPLPDTPLEMNGRSAGPATDGARYPLLMLNRGEEPLEIEAAPLLRRYFGDDEDAPIRYYELPLGEDPGEIRVTDTLTRTLAPHSTQGFVIIRETM